MDAPRRPVVGVGAVVFLKDGRIVLVKRGHAPLAGQWSLPGGKLEYGETLEAGVAREVLEETGLQVDVGPVIEVFDRMHADAGGDVEYHFVLVDFLCRQRGGELAAASDAEAVAAVDPADAAGYGLTDKARAVIARAVDMNRRNAPGDD